MLSLFSIYCRGKLIGEAEATDELHARIDFIERHPRILKLHGVIPSELSVVPAEDWLSEAGEWQGQSL